MNVMQGPGGDGGDLTDAMRQWLRDEAAKTQAWIVENAPAAGMHTHNVFNNRGVAAHGVHVPYSAEADPAVPDWAAQQDHSDSDDPPWDTTADGS